MGRLFFERAIGSVEAERIVKRITSRLSGLARNAQIREDVMDEYLVLYVHFHAKAKQASSVHLLAIRHQKQLGFDLLAGRCSKSSASRAVPERRPACHLFTCTQARCNAALP